MDGQSCLFNRYSARSAVHRGEVSWRASDEARVWLAPGGCLTSCQVSAELNWRTGKSVLEYRKMAPWPSVRSLARRGHCS